MELIYRAVRSEFNYVSGHFKARAAWEKEKAPQFAGNK